MTPTDAPWLDDHEPAPATSQQLGMTVTAAARKHKALAAQIEALETKLKEAKASLRMIEERTLPDLMDQMGVTEIRTGEGVSIALDQVITASLTNAETMKRAVAWIRSIGSIGLLRREIIAEFGPGQSEDADRLFAAMQDAAALGMYQLHDAETVNTASYKALVRERLKSDGSLPPDNVGVYVVRKAILKG